jgi:CheY-like chemotaxis protein
LEHWDDRKLDSGSEGVLVVDKKSKKILIVDDDEDIVDSMRIMLESAGYQVIAASSGEEGLKVVEEQRPDLVLLDIMMEKLTTGFHIGYELRKHPEHKSIPIIIISSIGEATGFDIAAEKETDYIAADEFLEKPVKSDVLLKRVAELIEKRGR